ncbi:MAG: transcriptional regulator TrmB [Microgenomates group bacterium Gr01-1014_80]|nr:MAG: transcriptional regulator TrmB [Microgenomates group bacterium Gr01-1014_80]
MDTLGSLEQLGLSKKEAQIYVFLLYSGPSTPTEIANGTGIKRPNIYEYVGNLEKQGLVHYQLINKRKLIVASPPEKITELIEEKLNLAKQLVPTLAQRVGDSFQSKITFYKGKKAMQELFKDALFCQQKEIFYQWSPEDMNKILDKKVIEEFIKVRLKKGIKIRSLRPAEKESFYQNETDNEFGKKMTEVAYISPEYSFSLSYAIYDDKAAFYSSQKESYGFLVESKEFAEVQRMLYQIAWNNSGKLNQ